MSYPTISTTAQLSVDCTMYKLVGTGLRIELSKGIYDEGYTVEPWDIQCLHIAELRVSRGSDLLYNAFADSYTFDLPLTGDTWTDLWNLWTLCVQADVAQTQGYEEMRIRGAFNKAEAELEDYHLQFDF